MGFGWLFFGYFVSTLMTLNQAGNLFRLVGFGIMLGAAGKLRQYHRSFGLVQVGAALAMAVSAILAAGDITDFLWRNLLLEAPLFGDKGYELLGYARQIASFLLGAMMLYAIRAIAKETEVKKISDGAVRNFVFLCMYSAVIVVSYLWMNSQNTTLLATLTVAMWLFHFAVIFLDLWLLFSCYRWICDEEDVEMEQRPSRFEFVNEYRRQKEEKQAERQRRREERRQRKGGKG